MSFLYESSYHVMPCLCRAGRELLRSIVRRQSLGPAILCEPQSDSFMADGKSGFKRALAVDIAKPTHQEASEVEDFPSPPPLYTPTTKELEETLDKEMGELQP